MHRLFPRSALALGVAFSFSSLPSIAQTASTQPEVVVTANRTPIALEQSLASVSVITREDIEASASNDLLDLLRAVPGLDIVRGGGLGQQTSVFLRGTNSNHALVLIDGVRVSSLGTGAFAWERLSPGQIDRIEVVRGPRAAVWGSDAIGGVIQIFTRRVEGFDAELSVGNHSTFGAEAGAGRRDERGGFDLRVGYTDAGGINSQSPDGFAFDPDDDGVRHHNALLHGDVALGGQTLSAMASRRDNDIEFDQGESDSRQSQLALALDGEWRQDWNQHLALASVRDTLITPAFFSRYDSRREQLDWNHAIALAGSDAGACTRPSAVAAGSSGACGSGNELLFGIGYVRERGANIDTFAGDPVYRAHRHNRAGYAAWRVGAEAHAFELSGRYDDNSQFGGESTFSAAWGWQASDLLRTTLSWGEGFRAPTLNELYSPGFGGLFAGNPELDPERSHSIEAGADLALTSAARLGLRLYRNDVRGLIDFSGGDTYQAINIHRVRIDGVEIDTSWERADWALSANATWQDATDRESGTPLLRRPDRKASVILDRRFDGGARIGLEGHAAASRPEFGGDLPGYGLLSLRASLPLSSALTLDARVENLLDRDYVLVRGFNTPGMTALVTLRWRGD